MKPVSLFFILLFSAACACAQSAVFSKKADSLYRAKNYSAAAPLYIKAAKSTARYETPKGHYYNAACCYALSGNQKLAKKYLQLAVEKYGYSNLDNMQKDGDLVSLHADPVWDKLIKKIQQKRIALHDPRRARLVTDDIHHFWKAYDRVLTDTTRRKEIFVRDYFNHASPGLQDYFATKIGTIDQFVRNQARKPRFYAAIRQNTLAIDTMKEEIYGYFDKLKSLYDEATFPDIYFLIGRWNSAGTVSDNGLLLGVDQIAKSPGIPEEELNMWERNNFTPVKKIPVIVIHELVHFQQSKMKEDTTLLFYAMVEGMADFICELVTGSNPSQRQQDWAQTRRRQVWEDFQKEMYLQRYSNWIANGNQETADKPADLGYYMGYEICKAYYEKATDKKAAIKEMLELQDPKAFLEKSRYGERFK